MPKPLDIGWKQETQWRETAHRIETIQVDVHFTTLRITRRKKCGNTHHGRVDLLVGGYRTTSVELKLPGCISGKQKCGICGKSNFQRNGRSNQQNTPLTLIIHLSSTPGFSWVGYFHLLYFLRRYASKLPHRQKITMHTLPGFTTNPLPAVFREFGQQDIGIVLGRFQNGNTWSSQDRFHKGISINGGTPNGWFISWRSY